MLSKEVLLNTSSKTYKREEIFSEVVKYFKGDELAANSWINKYALKDSEGNLYERTPDDMHRRIAKEIARVELNYKNPLTEDEIFDVIKNFKYIVPQGGSMSGIGNNKQTVSLSNCFVIGHEYDSYGAILRVDEEQVQLMKRRGGVGHDLSHVRPKGSPVKNSALTSTGIVPFMERYSNTTREVAQDGRRGALMLSLSSKHPDAESFIDAKMESGKVTGANVSVKITDDFMESVKNGGEYTQQYPIDSPNPVFVKKTNSKNIFDKIIHNAWKSAEPGILFWDTIINESIPDCYVDEGFKTTSTNPCFPSSEYLLTQNGYVKFGKLFDNKRDNVVVCDNRISYNDEGDEKPENWVIDNDKFGTINRNASNVFLTKANAEIIEIKTSMGFSLKCTPDHHIATTIGMVEAKDLTPEHEILIAIPENNNSIIGIKPSTPLEHTSMLIGLITGDGCFDKNGCTVHLDFWGDDKSRMLNMVIESIDYLYSVNGELKNNRNVTLAKYFISEVDDKIRITSPWLCKYLETFDFSHSTKHDVPEFIMNFSSVSVGKYYLAGLMYYNGSVQGKKENGYSVRLSKSNNNLLKKVQMMLHSNGIVTSLYSRQDEKNTLLPDGKGSSKFSPKEKQYELITVGGSLINYKERIGFLGDKIKEENLNVDYNFIIKSSFTDTLIEIVEHKNEPVFCIKEDIGRNIIVNGISTRRCGEIPLCPYDSCRLLAINLYSYVNNPFTPEATFDYELFKKHVQIAQRIMDDIIDLELEKIDSIIEKLDNDPEPDHIKVIERNLWENLKNMAIKGRRTGVGVTAEGDMLAALGFIYGTKDATAFSVEIHKTLAINAYKSSCYLAKDRGSFQVYNWEKEKNNPMIKRLCEADTELADLLKKYGRRNIALLTIAPTGTVSLMTQTTSGIEPVFLPIYKRRRKINPNDKNVRIDFVDENGDSWEEYLVIHPKFLKWMKVNGYDIEDVRKKSDDYIKELIKLSPYNNATSADVDWVEKVRMQGEVQKWVDHSISVTVNLPENVTEDVVAKVYMTAWESRCKGITVYREGSRSGVLISNKDNKEDKSVSQIIKDNNAPKRPKKVECEIMRFQNNHEKWIGFLGLYGPEGQEKRPIELFTGIIDSFPIPTYVDKGWIVKEKNGDDKSRYDFIYVDKDGYEQVIKGLNRAFNPNFWNIAKLISGILRHGMPIPNVYNLIDTLELEDGIVSWKTGVKRMFKKFIKDGTEVTGQKCPECQNEKLKFQDGCVSCDCGWSKCS